MAIQMRRGLKADFDPSKMLPGEWSVSIDSDTGNQIVWMCFAAGVVKRMGTYEDFRQQIAEATDDIRKDYLSEFQSILDEIDKLAEETKTNTNTVVTIRDDFLNTYLPQMQEYLTGTANNATSAKNSATAAAASEANAKASETNAKESETEAKASETSASYSAATATEQASIASTSAIAAATSETNASASAESASGSAQTATEKATQAGQSAASAEASATTATEKASESSASTEQASGYADMSKSYAVGTDGAVREGDATDNSKYYYEQAKQISQSVNGIVPMGTITFDELPTSDIVKNAMYNISNSFTSDSRFADGGGKPYGAGSNVYYTSDGKWDVLAASTVMGVKGAKESTYRQGNVNITCDDIGALASDGDSKDNTVTFTSGDSTSPTAWTDVSVLASGEKHSSFFAKISKMFKNIRYIFKMLGATDISAIGDGTTTGAISALSSILGVEISEYDSTKSYGANDIVVHDGKLYRSTRSPGISLAPVTGDFDTSDWEDVNAIELLERLHLAENVYTNFKVNYSGNETLGGAYNSVNAAVKAIYDKTKDINTAMGTADISGIGDGTVKGGLSTLNTNLTNHKISSDHDLRYYTKSEIDNNLQFKKNLSFEFDGSRTIKDVAILVWQSNNNIEGYFCGTVRHGVLYGYHGYILTGGNGKKNGAITLMLYKESAEPVLYPFSVVNGFMYP